MTPPASKEQIRRKQRAGVYNRAISWILLIVLIAADLTYRTSGGEAVATGDTIDSVYRTLAWVLQIAMIITLFVHAGLSLYVFGRVPFRRTLRVFHIYFGYGLLILVLVSQTTFGWSPWHQILTVLMYLAIVFHIVLGI